MKITLIVLFIAGFCLIQPDDACAQRQSSADGRLIDSAVFYQMLHYAGVPLSPTSKAHLKGPPSASGGLPNTLITSVNHRLNRAIADVSKQFTNSSQLPGEDAGKLQQQLTSSFPFPKILPRVNKPSFGSLSDKLPVNQLSSSSRRLKDRAASFGSSLTQKAGILKKTPVTFDLTLEDAVRYRPLSAITGLGTNDRFVNVINIRGTTALYGIPLNIDLSTQPRLAGSGQLLDNSLFKFDLDPNGFKNMLSSEIDEYRRIGASQLSGMNLTDYAKSKVNAEISRAKERFNGDKINGLIRTYLDKPGAMAELLSSSGEQIKRKVMDEATRAKQDALIAGRSAGLAEIRSLSPAAMADMNRLTARKAGLDGIAGNEQLFRYFTSSDNRSSLRLMNEDQISAKISALMPDKAIQQGFNYNALCGIDGLDLDALLTRLSGQQKSGKESAIRDAARALMISAKQDEVVDFRGVLKRQRAETDGRIAQLADLAYLPLNKGGAESQSRVALSFTEHKQLVTQADSIAKVISDMKAQLTANGVNVERLLTIQQVLERQIGQGELSESARSLYAAGPAGFTQGLVSRFSALKIGSFSHQPADLVRNRDVLMQGAHIKLNTGRFPLTAGYGTVSDLNAVKDQEFNASVYNQPRRMTYIGTEIRNPSSGGLKFLMISSFGGATGNRNYTLPAISGNNVAMTVSKEMKMGKFGSMDLDVSKSTTLFSNKYQIGTDLLLERKGGLNYDAATDLFSAMSFGAAHHLDISSQELTEDVYISYSGTGYQNPGVNGPGGARTKFGGNLRKTFLNRRLQVALRSDFNNQPISFTSDDRWKTRQVQLDGRYQLNRKLNFSAKYISNSTDKQIDGVNGRVYSFDKFQLGANANYKIGRYLSISRLLISGQALSNGTIKAAPGTRMFMMNYMQSMVLDRNVLTANIFYNKELAAINLIGDMLNADASLQYHLSKKFGLSSGLTYLSNANTARQAGVRQSLNYRASQHFNVSAFVDARKNLIRPLYPDLYSACRAELSLQYRINY